MTRLASALAQNLIRRDRPLTREELFVVPSVFSEDKHESRSERYTYIPTISLLTSERAFSPSLPVRPECVTQVAAITQSTLRLRRGQITGASPEIILLNQTAPARIRCCRDYSARYARTACLRRVVWRCVGAHKEMS
jgi:hypothetical protein